jgi:predicted site-specific integrase-resolvase|tara:strand:+ start:1815 stop:2129 length:315 start_codon:yes stop_codon:yes gene_type:complete
MANINPESKFSLSLKEVVGAVVGLASVFGIYFTLQASVASNSENIEEIKNDGVSSVEFQYKDELVRSTIQRIEEKQEIMNEDVNEIKGQLDKIDERLYQISKNR